MDPMRRSGWNLQILVGMPFLNAKSPYFYRDVKQGTTSSQVMNHDHMPVMYKLAANTMSRFMALEAASIFLWSAELPIIAAAFLNSRHVSSSLTIVLTISPSGTSVSAHISANGVPCHRIDGKMMKLDQKQIILISVIGKEMNLCPFVDHFNKAKLEIVLSILLGAYL